MNATADVSALAEAGAADFLEKFGRRPRWVVAAPGRVNLIGEHTDYNDGFVLPMAISRHLVIAADRVEGKGNGSGSGRAQLYSTSLGESATFSVEEPVIPGPIPWARYVEGVVAGFLANGAAIFPFEAIIASDLPPGAGLSSSAALEVATATLLEAMTGTRLDPLAKTRLCQKAEHDFAGVPCGIMDQMASVFGRAGHVLLLDCRSLGVRMVPIRDPDIVALVINSKVKHALTDGGYAARRRQCEEACVLLEVAALRDVSPEQLDGARRRLGDLLYRRARHVVTENIRTLQTADVLELDDWNTVSRLMYASHASLRDDYEVSCPELDLLVELAHELGPDKGVIGSRMTGGGFGGCTISLVRRDKADEIAYHIAENYRSRTGRDATAFLTSPSDGARVLKA